MKFAFKGSSRVLAEVSGDTAQCQCCGIPVRAYLKNADRQVRSRGFTNHWKHINGKMCDKWWENETEWHRNWKNKFPENWQEYVNIDSLTGEKHIADIFTSGRKEEIVIEFQNSKISELEVTTRENFYKKMIWVVNANSFKISLGSNVDKGNEGKALLNDCSNLKAFIVSFYDKYSGEAYSYTDKTVPFKDIDIDKCINIIERYAKREIGFDQEFKKFKSAIAEYLIIKERIEEYEAKIKEQGYFRCYSKNSNFWRIAACPVFFDLDGYLYRIIHDDDNKIKDVEKSEVASFEEWDDEEYFDDEWDFDGELEDDIVKKYSYNQFIDYYKS